MVDFSTRADDLFIQTPNTFNALPAATMFPGARAMITDSPTLVIGTAVTAGSGSNKVLLVSDGTSWVLTEAINTAGVFTVPTLNASSIVGLGTISNASTISVIQTAFPTGGQAGLGIKLSTATNFGLFIGTGAPSLAAATCSLYMRSDGATATTRLYVSITAAGGTTSWTAILASA